MKKDLVTAPFAEQLDGADFIYEAIFARFKELCPELPDELLGYMQENSEFVTFQKDQIILNYGRISTHAYFTISGMVRATRRFLSGVDTPVWFMGKGEILISPESYYSQSPSLEKLTAHTEMTCIAMEKARVEEMYKLFPLFNVVSRKLTERYYRQALERTWWMYLSPSARYLNLAQHFPEVLKTVKVRMLADFLGIARETLSRIRSSIRFAKYR